MTADLLRLLEQTRPDLSPAEREALIAATPDRAPRKPQDGKHHGAGTFPIRKPQRPPVRAIAIERRRRLASSGPLPPSIACRYTVGQQAVLRIVGDEIRDKGSCTLPLAAIAARAGTCRKLVQTTIRIARQEGLLAYQERRRPGQVSQTNVLTIASKEWAAWLTKGPRSKSIGGKKFAPTDTRVRNQSELSPTPNGSKGFRKEEGRIRTDYDHDTNQAGSRPRATPARLPWLKDVHGLRRGEAAG